MAATTNPELFQEILYNWIISCKNRTQLDLCSDFINTKKEQFKSLNEQGYNSAIEALKAEITVHRWSLPD